LTNAGPIQPSPGRAPKFGERVAAAIELQIRDLGWPVGHMLGTETSLIAQHGVSRAVLREAIRQVEQRGIAEMRRGRGGGLVVAEPVEGVVVRALTTYLEAIDVSLPEILETQLILEIQAAALAADVIDQDGIKLLRSLAEQLPPPIGVVQVDAAPHTEIRAQIARVAGNRALALFIRSLNMSTVDMRSMLVGPAMEHRYRERVEGSIAKKKALIEAIVSGNAARARQIVGQDAAEQLKLYEIFAQSGVRRGELRSVLRASEADDAKLSQAVMLKLAQDVSDLAAPIGHRIGSEAEMLQRYGVGRAVFREAIRPLEQHGVVKMRRGAKGGLFVASPDPSGTVAMTTDYFRFMRITADELIPIREQLELEAVELAVTRASDDDIEGLRVLYVAQASPITATARGAAARFHERLIEMSGNRVLALLIRILRGMNGPEPADGIGGQERGARHAALLDAITARDAAIARRLMVQRFREKG
jgi:DNA-binding FadR family transcriptional regulator